MKSSQSIRLETPRLTIRPLTLDQLMKYLQADMSLEAELEVLLQERIIPEELLEPLQERIIPAVTDTTKNYLYHTLWVIISKEEQKLVGDLCFKGEPNANGEIEIGYGTFSNFKNKGYMTEAVGAIIKWAAVQPAVQSIIAETWKNNIPSMRILEKNNFQQYKTNDEMVWWRLDVKE